MVDADRTSIYFLDLKIARYLPAKKTQDSRTRNLILVVPVK